LFRTVEERVAREDTGQHQIKGWRKKGTLKTDVAGEKPNLEKTREEEFSNLRGRRKREKPSTTQKRTQLQTTPASTGKCNRKAHTGTDV